jgi:hypothetical protein
MKIGRVYRFADLAQIFTAYFSDKFIDKSNNKLYNNLHMENTKPLLVGKIRDGYIQKKNLNLTNVKLVGVFGQCKRRFDLKRFDRL